MEIRYIEGVLRRGCPLSVHVNLDTSIVVLVGLRYVEDTVHVYMCM